MAFKGVGMAGDKTARVADTERRPGFGRRAWLRREWLRASFGWESPGQVCAQDEFDQAGLVGRPADAEKFCALEQTWAVWQGLA